MFERLNAHHDAIVAAAARLEDIVGASQPDLVRLANARLAIARLSWFRASLLEGTIYPSLRGHLCEDEEASVRRLREERLRYLAKTSRHIAAWNARRVADELPEFRCVFAGFLGGLWTRVAAEKAILSPLIEKVQALPAEARTIRIYGAGIRPINVRT